MEKNFIERKDPLEGIKIYKITRKFFSDIEVHILNEINEKRNKGGVSLSEVLRKVNR